MLYLMEKDTIRLQDRADAERLCRRFDLVQRVLQKALAPMLRVEEAGRQAEAWQAASARRS